MPPAAVRAAKRVTQRKGSTVHRELERITSLPWGAPAETALLGPKFRVLHAQAFVSQYRAIYEERVYDFEPATAGPRIIDGGANMGMATMFWKRRWPAARITAIEADPALAEVVRANLSAANIGDVDLVVAALAPEPGRLRFLSDGRDTGHIDDAGNLQVDAISLRPYLAETVDLLKLDIEGAETAVLSSCSDLLTNVERVFVEYHSIVGAAQPLAVLHGTLEQAGFRLHIRSDYCSQRPFVKIEPSFGMDCRLNIWATR